LRKDPRPALFRVVLASLAACAVLTASQPAHAQFPKIEELKEGLGAIRLDFRADVPSGGSARKMVFENHHQKAIGAYLANALVPRDPQIQITTQKRNEDQSIYELRYEQPGGGIAWRSGEAVLTGIAALLVLGRLAWLWPTWKGRRPAGSQYATSIPRPGSTPD